MSHGPFADTRNSCLHHQAFGAAVLACLAGLWSESPALSILALRAKCWRRLLRRPLRRPISSSAWLGLLFAIVVSLAFALVHGYASINQRGNQVVSGVAINMLAAGLAVVLGNTWFKEGGRTPALPVNARFMPIELPGQGLAGVPLLGRSMQKYLGPFDPDLSRVSVVPLTAWALAQTRFGLRLRAVGENPHAVDTAGISVARSAIRR